MKRFFSAVTAACCAAIGAVLVINGKAAAQGTAEGISLCLNTVIPSLFCFMVLTGFLVQSGIYRLLSLPLAPVAKHLFFLPSDTASIILLSFVGGYPMSAKAISDLLACRRISFSCAQRMLLFLRRTFVYYHGNRRRNVRQRFGRYFFVPHSGFHFLPDWNCFGNLFPNSFSHPFAARFLPCPCCRAADFLQPRLCQFCGAGSTNLRANVRIRYSV